MWEKGGRKPQETLGLWQSSPVKLNPPSLSSTNGVRCFDCFLFTELRLDSTEHEELSTFLLLLDFYLVFKYAGRPMTQGDMVPPCTTLHWSLQPSWHGQHPKGLQGTTRKLNVDFSWTAEGLQGAGVHLAAFCLSTSWLLKCLLNRDRLLSVDLT